MTHQPKHTDTFYVVEKIFKGEFDAQKELSYAKNNGGAYGPFNTRYAAEEFASTFEEKHFVVGE